VSASFIKNKQLIVVLGPTAVGKTAYAIKLAQEFQTEIISADSRQFYAELNIGVARPSLEELQAVPHHFIGFLPISEYYSAGAFERDALTKLNELFEHHDKVICCGGSMMYVDALLYGLDELPSDPAVRMQLNDRLEKEGLEVLAKELIRLDPEYYNEVDHKNSRRVIRALEVCMITSEKFSTLRKATRNERTFEIRKVGLNGPREWLYDRINRRVDGMMQNGLEEEVLNVLPYRHLNALNTVGYKEWFEYFDGKVSKEFVIEKIKQHSRNFAKRQLTWWKRDEEIEWIDAHLV
jgi:tRNA dimethylallyltransferase